MDHLKAKREVCTRHERCTVAQSDLPGPPWYAVRSPEHVAFVRDLLKGWKPTTRWCHCACSAALNAHTETPDRGGVFKQGGKQSQPDMTAAAPQSHSGGRERRTSGHPGTPSWACPGSSGVFGTVSFPRGCEGPEDGVHGGMLATFMDECIATAVYHSKKQSRPLILMAQLNMSLKAKTPLTTTLGFESHIDSAGWQGRKVWAHGRIFDMNTGRSYIEATGLWLTPRDADSAVCSRL